MKELDLSLCQDINTQIHYAIKNNNKLNIESITNFKEKGIDIFNLKDKFFTDLCYSYSDSNNDMTIEDRIKYLYQNYSLCEKGCTYNNLDIENMNIACTCKMQGNANESLLNMTPLVYEQPKEASFFDSNIGVVKCYGLVFSVNNKLNNIGFFIFSTIFLFYIIFIICFCINGIKPVKDYLSNEMIKNGYSNKIKNIKTQRIIKKNKKNINKKKITKTITRKGMISNISNPNRIKKINKNLKNKTINKKNNLNSNQFNYHIFCVNN